MFCLVLPIFTLVYRRNIIYIYFILLGDYDAILSLLLLPRMIWKSEILMTHVRDKYPDVQEITMESLMKDHSAEQFATRSRLSFYLYSLQVYIYIFNYIFNKIIRLIELNLKS